MAETNLGKALQDAGVKGAKLGDMTLAQAQAIAIPRVDERDLHPRVALNGLPKEFEELRKIEKGRDFLRRLEEIVARLANAGKSAMVTKHVVFALVQLAHERRDVLGGSKRMSFVNGVIPTLLDTKYRVENREGSVAGVVLQRLRG